MKRLHVCVYCGGHDPPGTCGHWLDDDLTPLWKIALRWLLVVTGRRP